MLHARQLGRFTRREPEDGPGERFKNEILRAVGQHRYEDEDGEAARLRFGPYVRQGFAKRRLGRDTAIARRDRRRRRALDVPHRG